MHEKIQCQTNPQLRLDCTQLWCYRPNPYTQPKHSWLLLESTTASAAQTVVSCCHILLLRCTAL
jgi:hypothetical protein